MENQKLSSKSVIYVGEDHKVLINGNVYEVKLEGKDDIQVVSPTGFCGVPKKDVKFI